MGATVAGDKIRERRLGGGEFAGETVVEYYLSIKSRESKRSLASLRISGEMVDSVRVT